jgi:hypothetical protein
LVKLQFDEITHYSNEAEVEAYEYFVKNIRPLPKNQNGKIDPSQIGFQDNDVDAFRHAYVSGVFTQEYNEVAADIFGRMNEWSPGDIYSNSTNPGSKNMDLWNNAIGRKYGAKTESRKTLLKKIQKALVTGELIVDPKDKRKYEGVTHNQASKVKPLIVLQEDKKGRNKLFYDTIKKQILSVDELVVLIEEGQYPGYAVKVIRGISTPVSNPDGRGTNNLG